MTRAFESFPYLQTEHTRVGAARAEVIAHLKMQKNQEGLLMSHPDGHDDPWMFLKTQFDIFSQDHKKKQNWSQCIQMDYLRIRRISSTTLEQAARI